MNLLDLIIKKRNGMTHSKAEIDYLVKRISDGSMPDYQVAAWTMAVYFQGMNEEETRNLALAMAFSGDTVDLAAVEGIPVDKHSTGGVGDKTTMIVVPLVAAAGVPVAKMSGRGLGHTGGTIDKFESIPGFKVEMEHAAFIRQVNDIKAAVIAQSGHLVPADKRLYALRDLTGTVESLPLIASSVMSKKIASGAQGIVLDVKVGSGAFMKNEAEARALAQAMADIGRGAGRKVTALISDMQQPLGRMVGNALEVREAIDTLRGIGPADLSEISILLAAHMLVLGGKFTDLESARDYAGKMLYNGQGFEKFQEMVEAQGGRLDYNSLTYGLEQAAIKETIHADTEGYLAGLDALGIGRAAMRLGAGREQLGDIIDHAVGIELVKKYGDPVKPGDPLAIIHANDKDKMYTACADLPQAFTISSRVPPHKPLILGLIK